MKSSLDCAELRRSEKMHIGTGARKTSKKWDDYFMRVAFAAAMNSTCLRHSFGAVLVNDKRIVSTGYNGSPAGSPNCSDCGFCLKDQHGLKSGDYGAGHECHAVHAEANAVIQAGRDRAKGGILYSTGQPCYQCAKLIVNAGIIEVVFVIPYPDPKTVALFGKVGPNHLWEGPVVLRRYVPDSLAIRIRGRNADEMAVLASIKGIESYTV